MPNKEILRYQFKTYRFPNLCQSNYFIGSLPHKTSKRSKKSRVKTDSFSTLHTNTPPHTHTATHMPSPCQTCRVPKCLVTKYLVPKWLVTKYLVPKCLVPKWLVTKCLMTKCFVTKCLVPKCPVTKYPVTKYLVTKCFVTKCLVPKCLVTKYPVPKYPVPKCLVTKCLDTARPPPPPHLDLEMFPELTKLSLDGSLKKGTGKKGTGKKGTGKKGTRKKWHRKKWHKVHDRKKRHNKFFKLYILLTTKMEKGRQKTKRSP